MMNQEHRTNLKQRVRIKDYVTHMYPNARVYSEGFVVEQTHDNMGYPLIFIQWDRNHWAYSGEEDRWVLESHFDPVEGSMAEDKETDFIEMLSKLLIEYQNQDKEDSAKSTSSKEELTYENVLEKGAKDAAQADAFILFVASPEKYNGRELLMPHIYMHSASDDAALVLDAATADYVAQSFGRLIQEYSRGKRDASSST